MDGITSGYLISIFHKLNQISEDIKWLKEAQQKDQQATTASATECSSVKDERVLPPEAERWLESLYETPEKDYGGHFDDIQDLLPHWLEQEIGSQENEDAIYLNTEHTAPIYHCATTETADSTDAGQRQGQSVLEKIGSPAPGLTKLTLRRTYGIQ